MGKINWARVFLGGTLAAIVLVALSTIFSALFEHPQLSTALAAVHSFRMVIAGSAFFVAVFLVLGTLMTWWYVTIRPFFGPGPKTASIAALAVWVTVIWVGVVGFALESLVMNQPYPLPAGPALPILCLGIMVASTIAGASVYREQQN